MDKKTKQELRDEGYLIDVCWNRSDIENRAEETGILLTEDQTNEAVDKLVDNFDANLGINWNVIDSVISDVAEYEPDEEEPEPKKLTTRIKNDLEEF